MFCLEQIKADVLRHQISIMSNAKIRNSMPVLKMELGHTKHDKTKYDELDIERF